MEQGLGRDSGAGASKCKYLWDKNQCNLQKSVAAVLDIGLFSGERCWSLLQSMSLAILMLPLHGLHWYSCSSSLFLAISICLSFDGLGGMKLKWDLHVVPKRLETGRASHSSFAGEGNPLPEKPPLGTEQCLLGGCDDAGKMNLSFFSSWAVILRFCFSTVLPKFLNWTTELSHSCFCSWIAV